jgi:hypothetical protein
MPRVILVILLSIRDAGQHLEYAAANVVACPSITAIGHKSDRNSVFSRKNVSHSERNGHERSQYSGPHLNLFFCTPLCWRVEPRSQKTRERDGPNLRSEVKQNA